MTMGEGCTILVGINGAIGGYMTPGTKPALGTRGGGMGKKGGGNMDIMEGLIIPAKW
jgi:hypothetical protein